MRDQLKLECQEKSRRQVVREKHRNGIDYVEVDEIDSRNLCVQLFGTVPENIDKGNVLIEGGRRIRDIEVTKVAVGRSPEAELDDCILVTVDKAGDFSTYTLRLVEVENGKSTGKPFHGFDPRYSKVQFSFKVNCPSDLDCKTEAVCPPETRDEPEISYLAKDYASFRQLILDRLALIMPDWQERHVPDIGIALVEVLAYVGDYLSYYQDAVATEAYLDTARQRISVRRHARLVDYQLHEGCNARTWVTVSTNQDLTDDRLKLRDLYFSTADATAPEVFEPMRAGSAEALKLYVAHNEIRFYTWGDEECCLPRGATTATLQDNWIQEKTEPKPDPSNVQTKHAEYNSSTAAESPKAKRSLQLKKDDILIFEEVIGPKTGNFADADRTRRWAVRLTRDGKPDIDPLNDQPIVEIEWAAEDALPFSLCLSARRPAPDCDLLVDVSVACGNVILVDHGKTIDPEEDLGQVGETEIVGECACEGSVLEVTDVPAAFRPRPLKQSPLTFSEPLSHTRSASVMLNQDPRKALPNIVSLKGLPGICSKSDGKPEIRDGVSTDSAQWLWNPKLDLLGSQSQDQNFVVEMDNDGRAHLRFGDGDLGRRPEACMIFSTRYRVGNGPAGNVGADTLTTAAFRGITVSGLTLHPRNPLPAQGGTSPEPISEAKLFAPGAFRNDLQRAVIADDYARLAERNYKVQRAAASLRWTGSWYAAQVAIDPLGSETASEGLLHRIERDLHRYRRMGHDLEVRQAVYVPLEIELQVCVLPHYLRGHIEAALLDVFSSRRLRDGQFGFFHPDNLTFGEGIYLSKLVAAAQAVPGVESAQVTVLQRLGEGDHGELDEGILRLSPLEVAQLDNDPSFPERGTLKLKIGGGR
jgi:hypothetical protein